MMDVVGPDGSILLHVSPDDPRLPALKDRVGYKVQPSRSHVHAVASGEVLVVSCGCCLALREGRVIGRVEACRAHGGDRRPGDCRACDTAVREAR